MLRMRTFSLVKPIFIKQDIHCTNFLIIHVAQFMKKLITGFDSYISDKCKIQKYYLELKKKLNAYIMSRF